MDEALIRRVETAALWAWPPRETRFLDGWLLCAAARLTRRTDSVRAHDWRGGAPDAAITAVEDWYAARGQPPCFMLTDIARPAGLDTALERRGYARLPAVSVELVDPAGLRADPGVALEHRPSQAVLNALLDPYLGKEARGGRAALFGRIRREHRFALLTRGGEPAAAGLVVLDGDLAGVFAMRTQVPFRGQGLAQAVFRTLAAWAHGRGARTLYLQVEDEAAAARALYRRYAPARLHGYWYREPAA